MQGPPCLVTWLCEPEDPRAERQTFAYRLSTRAVSSADTRGNVPPT